MRVKTADLARSKWKGILIALGVDEKFLSKRHGPCPFCGGVDRFRFDDKAGNGTFICSSCGSGGGVEFVKRAKNWDFQTAVQEIDKIVGGVQEEPRRPALTDQQRVDILGRLWNAGVRLTAGDPVCAYLASRDVLPDFNPGCLRYVERCPVPHDGGFAPAMIARVQEPSGRPINIHRTFLADPAPGQRRQRAMMPGEIDPGSAVRLSPIAGVRLGIGEGIETALAAGRKFGVPTWAALNSAMLEKWIPPEGIEEVLIFGDADAAFGGQGSAYKLGYRLVTRNRLRVQVHIPRALGLDWADREALPEQDLVSA